MHCLFRKGILVLVIVSFLAMVTGLITTLHFLSRENHQEHGPDDCAICQQLLTIKKGFSYQPEPKVDYTDQFKHYDVTHYVFFIEQIYLQTFNARPPPEVS